MQSTKNIGYPGYDGSKPRLFELSIPYSQMWLTSCSHSCVA